VSSVLAFPIADVCLTAASRGGDVGQASVPSLDAQVAESRRGPARRVAGVLFFVLLLSLPSLLFSAALWFPSLSVSVLITKKRKNTKQKKQKIYIKIPSKKTIKAIKISRANQKFCLY
jgi:hypothetical protein